MKNVLAIVGSYRKGGMTDQLADAVLEGAAAGGAEVEKIYLLDKSISYCTNCRTCTQTPGEERGICPHEDDMAELLDRIESADSLIFAASTNYYNVTAMFRKFMERTVGYAHWPWGTPAPKVRKKKRNKKAVVITTSAAPSFLGRIFFGSIRALKATAGVFGAKTVGSLYVGLSGQQPDMKPSEREIKKARRLGEKLA